MNNFSAADYCGDMFGTVAAIEEAVQKWHSTRSKWERLDYLTIYKVTTLQEDKKTGGQRKPGLSRFSDA